MKKNILFLVSGIAAGIVLCLVTALHLPVKKNDEEDDWSFLF